MEYEATILIKEDPALLAECFGPELKNEDSDRSSVKVHKEKKGIRFEVTAKDSVALRATVVNITKLCTVV